MSLDVYLYGARIGELSPDGDDEYRFAYDPAQVEALGLGIGLLGNALPVRAEPFSAETTRSYVEGLLPEGQRRARMGRELGIDAADGYRLLAEIGGDCPGAVCFVPSGQPVRRPAPDEVSWLGDEELAELLRPPPPSYFSDDSPLRMRATLPGIRHKLSLVHDEAGDRWAWPEPGLPSTHVIKPETGEFPGMIANEMFCTTIVRQLGLSVAHAEVKAIAGRRCIVSHRYDRVGQGLDAKRLHCESFVQALGIPPAAAASGEADAPGFAEACGLIRAIGDERDIVRLFSAAICNHIIGNGDAHGRNFVLLDPGRTAHCERPGPMRLAPLTDLLSTAVYDDPIHSGMTVAEGYDENVYLVELAEICEQCEIDFDVTRSIAAMNASRVGRALETVATRAALEGWHEPIVDKIVELTGARSFDLGSEVEY